MYIKNIRLGFATNSSSSHSILLVKNPDKYKQNISWIDDYFGWEEFLIKDKNTKKEYFYSLVTSSIRSKKDKLVVENYLKEKYYGNDYEPEYEGIDHESMICIPYNNNGNILFDYIDDLYEYVMQENVIIEGGNDNMSEEKYTEGLHIHNQDIVEKKNLLYSSDEIVGKKDKNTYILYNKLNGNKVRISFKKDVIYNKSTYPELVDIKITDKCNENCVMCYQNSTPTGKHANLDYIKSIIDLLAKAEVFEIAIGGGDALLHPDIEEIVYYIKSKGMCANITVNLNNIDIIKDIDKIRIISKCNAVALSIGTDYVNYKKYSTILYLLKNYFNSNVEIDLQIIPAMHDCLKFSFINTLFDKIDRDYWFYISLLGFKKTGRGNKAQIKSTNKEIEDFVINLSNKFGNHRIKVDTKFIENHKKFIEANYDKISYTIEEGKFSCYIDAVNKTINSSSFTTNKPVKFEDINISTLKNIYKEF